MNIDLMIPAEVDSSKNIIATSESGSLELRPSKTEYLSLIMVYSINVDVIRSKVKSRRKKRSEYDYMRNEPRHQHLVISFNDEREISMSLLPHCDWILNKLKLQGNHML